MIALKEAVAIVKSNEEDMKPLHAYESEKYFLFVMGNNSGEIIGNDSSYVVNRQTKEGKWVPRNALPLTDGGEYLGEYSLSS